MYLNDHKLTETATRELTQSNILKLSPEQGRDNVIIETPMKFEYYYMAQG